MLPDLTKITSCKISYKKIKELNINPGMPKHMKWR